MKSRLLAALLSVSMLFGSMPVNAAELGAGTNFESTVVSAQEEIADEFDNASEETTSTDDAAKDSEKNPEGEAVSSDVPSTDREYSDEDSVQDNTEPDDNSNDTPDMGDDNSGEITEGETADSEKSEADIDGTVEPEEQAENESIVGGAEEPDYDVTAEGVTALYEGDNTVILPGYDYDNRTTYKWLSFEAPEEGYYNLYVKEYSGSETGYYISMYDDINGNPIGYVYDRNMQSNHMNAGDTLYFRAYVNGYYLDDVTLNLEIKKLATPTNTVKHEDGSYSFTTEDYTLSVLPRAGVKTVRVDAAIEITSGNIRDESYNLIGFIREHGEVRDYNAGNYYLRRDRNYQDVVNIPAESEKEYNLRLILMDSQHNVLALFPIDNDTVFTTKPYDKDVKIYEVTATESTITMDLETMGYYECYYAPVDGSEAERNAVVGKGWDTFTFTGLRQETEYYFTFTDYNKNNKEVFETTASTTAATTTAEYNAEISEDGSSINIEAVVSGYEGTSTYAYLYYEYTNELGVHKSDKDYKLIEQLDESENGETSFTINSSVPIQNEAFEAGKEYDITMWLEIGYMDVTLSKDIVPVTPIQQAGFTAEQLTFSMLPNDSNVTSLDYNIQINTYEGNVTDEITGVIYYRPKDSKSDYSLRSITYSPDETQNPAIGTISGLDSCVDYDFILFLGGVKKEVTAYAGTKSVTLSLVEDGRNETKAFDIVRTFAVTNKIDEETLTGEYTLSLYRLINDSYYNVFANAVKFNTANEYRAEVMTASSIQLTPNTDYDLKWELKDASGNVSDVLYESIHTPKPQITFEPIESESSYSTQKFKVTLVESDRANFDDFDSLYLRSYIRKAGSNIYRNPTEIISLTSNDYSSYITFSGLDENTAYEISLRDNTGIEYASTTFTTPEYVSNEENNYTLSNISIYSSYDTAEVSAVLSGNEYGNPCYIYLFYKEQDKSDWSLAEIDYVDYSYYNYYGMISGLKPDTTYNYALVISDSYDCDSPDEVTNENRKWTGTFKTLARIVAEVKGFGLTGFNVSYDYSSYPAVKLNDGSYTIAYTSGITYTAKVELSPKQYGYDNEDFNWSISNSNADITTAIATVDEYGVITPKTEGDVKLTVTSKKEALAGKSVEVTLHIKKLPNQDGTVLNALANTSSKLSDISFPDSWGGGWSWKYPNTPFVTNGVYDDVYMFDAVYSGTDFYPCETTVSVNVGKITGAKASETSRPSHNQVLEVGSGDKLTLQVLPDIQGIVSSSVYDTEIPNVSGLKITPQNNGIYEIEAEKKGSYTLKPVIKASGGNGKVLASTTYKIKAVEDKQAATIVITPEIENIESNDDIIINGNTIIFKNESAKKDFVLNATVTDRNNAAITTAITWSTTDKTVAAVAAASKSDTHSAKVTVKGAGHTVITAKAKDTAGVTASINLEIQDHTPRVDTDKANVNVAFDYDSSRGKSFADSAGGSVEIVPAYGESISNVELRDKGSASKSSKLKLVPYDGYKYLVAPEEAEDLKAGKYDCTIVVTTNADKDNEYEFPLKVTVANKQLKVTAKMGTVPNLFFKAAQGQVNVKISGNNDARVNYVNWEDSSADVNNGFTVSDYGYNSSKKVTILYIDQQQGLAVTNGKLADTNVAKGTFTIRVNGYKGEYKFENFAIKYSYKKPTLTASNVGLVVPTAGVTKAAMNIYDKTNKRYIYYTSSNEGQYSNYYDEITCDSDDVTLEPRQSYSGPSYTYSGTAKSKNVNLSLKSSGWREALTVKFTIKTTTPKAYLSSSQLTFNTNLKTTAYSYIYLKNGYNNAIYKNIYIKGTNANAQKLLDDDLFVIFANGNRITVEQSEAAFMGSSIPAGTYSYKITPYYANPDTGEATALNTLTLKLKVINKAVTAKVSPKGNPDLTYAVDYDPENKGYYWGEETKNKVSLVDAKFSNLAYGYYVSDYKLVGEYSEYFKLYSEYITYGKKYGYHDFIYINYDEELDVSKLKANQSYKLAIEYTIANDNGEEFKVTSNTFAIKVKQSAPKITITNNNQTIYAAADNVYRYYRISVPSYYTVTGSSGGIDCNKDGKNDIIVSGSGSLTVQIVDRDALGATAKGKSYSIPVTISLKGRDGIAKDVKVTVKVKVKR